jgi:hypothetical protein
MSAGPFDLDGKYESDGGQVYRCRPQPETAGMVLDGESNSYPTGAVTAGVGSLKLSKGNRELGVVPRRVKVRWTAAPTGQIADYGGIGSTFLVPVFDPLTFSAYSEGDTGTYLGVACVLDKKFNEAVN